jgi:hypothetical protein
MTVQSAVDQYYRHQYFDPRRLPRYRFCPLLSECRLIVEVARNTGFYKPFLERLNEDK